MEPDPGVFYGQGLTFINTGSDLFYAATMLTHLTGDPDPARWGLRLASRYIETRQPGVGIRGYQFSQTASGWCNGPEIRGDRAQYQYAEFYPESTVYENTLFPCVRNRVEVEPEILMLHAYEQIGEPVAQFRQWAIEELTNRARSAFRFEDRAFVPMLTDGTSMEGFVVQKEGYFGPKGRVIEAIPATARHAWAYAMGWSHDRDPFLWKVLRAMAMESGIGDIGETPDSAREFDPGTSLSSVDAVAALLELHDATGDAAFLDHACRVGDNLIDNHFENGLFVESKGRYRFTKLDRPEPLMLLRLAARLTGRPEAVAPYLGGQGFYAAAYADQGHQYDNGYLYRLPREAEREDNQQAKAN